LSRLLIILLFLLFSTTSNAALLEDLGSIGLAYGTHILTHELGHYAYAEYYDMNPDIKFFHKENNNLHVGYVSVDNIPKERQFGFGASGDMASSVLFEIALDSYHIKPTTYNKSLIYITNYYFLLYTIYSFSFDDNNLSHDPVRMEKYSDISKLELLSLVLLKTWINQNRISVKSNLSSYVSTGFNRDGLMWGVRYAL